MLLLIDNYDSFVFNLARYFERLGQETHVVRNDAIDPAGIERLQPEAVVISPGPCSPNEAGCSVDVVRKLHGRFPLLGVCLGHQAIGKAFGGFVVQASEPMHGRMSQIIHDSEDIFRDMPSPFAATRYHSLIIARDSLPPSLRVTAWTNDGLIMAVAHQKHPVFGVQFHPESILSEFGFALLANFLRIAGVGAVKEPPGIESERLDARPITNELSGKVVTF
jgi:anthranilate synthase/aminodeoxychorismate synthase-like glutamine amidotransferase